MAYIDEVMKGSEELKKLLIGYVLSLHRDMGYHKMQSGGAHLPVIPAILLCDTDVEADYRADVQTARRTVRVDLGAGAVGKDWRKTCGGSVVGWRKRGYGFNAIAADIFLADVICQMRKEFHNKTFEEAAASLGFQTLSQPTADYDPDADLRALYYAWDAAEKYQPEAEDTNFRGAGWVVLHRAHDSHHPVIAALEVLLKNNWEDHQVINGAQWGEIIPERTGLTVKFKQRCNRVGLRFTVEPA
jgi:hypothetical protein